jgi:hypothetical protein
MSVNKNDEFFEDMTPRVTGHILIRDPESGEVFVNKRDGNRPSRLMKPPRWTAKMVGEWNENRW